MFVSYMWILLFTEVPYHVNDVAANQCLKVWVVPCLLWCTAAVLVDLLTLEVQSYGEESMGGVKVVEHVAPGPVSVACSGVPVTQPATAATTAVTGPRVRPPQPLPPPPPILTSQPSKQMFSDSISDTGLASSYVLVLVCTLSVGRHYRRRH